MDGAVTTRGLELPLSGGGANLPRPIPPSRVPSPRRPKAAVSTHFGAPSDQRQSSLSLPKDVYAQLTTTTSAHRNNNSSNNNDCTVVGKNLRVPMVTPETEATSATLSVERASSDMQQKRNATPLSHASQTRRVSLAAAALSGIPRHNVSPARIVGVVRSRGGSPSPTLPSSSKTVEGGANSAPLSTGAHPPRKLISPRRQEEHNVLSAARELDSSANEVTPISLLSDKETRAATAALIFKRRCIRACLADMAADSSVVTYSGVASPAPLLISSAKEEWTDGYVLSYSQGVGNTPAKTEVCVRASSPDTDSVVFTTGSHEGFVSSDRNVLFDSYAYARGVQREGSIPPEATVHFEAPERIKISNATGGGGISYVEPIAMVGPRSRAVNTAALEAISVARHSPRGIIRPRDYMYSQPRAHGEAEYEPLTARSTNSHVSAPVWSAENNAAVDSGLASVTNHYEGFMDELSRSYSDGDGTRGRRSGGRYADERSHVRSRVQLNEPFSQTIAEALRKGHTPFSTLMRSPQDGFSYIYGEAQDANASHYNYSPEALERYRYPNGVPNHTNDYAPHSSAVEVPYEERYAPRSDNQRLLPVGTAYPIEENLPLTVNTCRNCHLGGHVEYFSI